MGVPASVEVKGLAELQLYSLSSPEEWNTVVMKAVDHGGMSKKHDSGIKKFKSFGLYRIKVRVNDG